MAIHFLRDFFPEHLHFFLARAPGVPGLLKWIERAQYESPLLVPGAMVYPLAPAQTFLPFDVSHHFFPLGSLVLAMVMPGWVPSAVA